MLVVVILLIVAIKCSRGKLKCAVWQNVAGAAGAAGYPDSWSYYYY